MENIDEIFVLPINLKNVITIDGIPLYGSEELNKKFIESVRNTKKGKIIFKSIEKLVNNKTI